MTRAVRGVLVGMFELVYFFLQLGRQTVDAGMAAHFQGVHAADTVVGVAALAAGAFAALEFVDEVGVAYQGTGHLEGDETAVEDLFHAVDVGHSADIDEWPCPYNSVKS